MRVSSSFRGIFAVGLLLTVVSTSTAKYSGGTGEPNDPYQIATPDDLIALGENPEDYDKHFILTADIDLDPNLPGRKVFDKAVIAAGKSLARGRGSSIYLVYEGTAFTGVLDGNGHTISHLVIDGGDYLGLFGTIDSEAEIKNLGVVSVNIIGAGDYVGALSGAGSGTNCHTCGNVSGRNYVGGLVGSGSASHCHSTATVSGDVYIGGLLGSGVARHCHSTGSVSGDSYVGGLVGENRWIVSQCYSTGTVHGNKYVGGLVGHNGGSSGEEDSPGEIANCYSTGNVDGSDCVGGLVGQNYHSAVTNCHAVGVVSGAGSVGGLVGDSYAGTVTACFWDIETSGQATSDGGTGMITAEMQTGERFLIWGTCGNEGIWTIDEGKDYPRLRWENRPGEPIRMPVLPDLLLGSGTENDPFLIYTPEELNAVGLYPCEWDKHFRLMADIDLDPALPGRTVFDKAVIAPDADRVNDGYQGTSFAGIFDGNGHTITHLAIRGGGYLGLLGVLAPGAEVRNLRVVDANVVGVDSYVGALVGSNSGSVVQCCCTGVVSGDNNIGGLVGLNWGGVTSCYSRAAASGSNSVGGLVGCNWGEVTNCYSSGGEALAYMKVGGLVGSNNGRVTTCYSTDRVTAILGHSVGGLVGSSYRGLVTASFWDIQTSGQTTSAGGVGKTAAEMQTTSTFSEAGWDFVGETANGTDDTWWILEGKDYPRLWWELEAAPRQ